MGGAEAKAEAKAERAGDVELLVLVFSSASRLSVLSVLLVSVLLTAVRAGCSVGKREGMVGD